MIVSRNVRKFSKNAFLKKGIFLFERNIREVSKDNAVKCRIYNSKYGLDCVREIRKSPHDPDYGLALRD